MRLTFLGTGASFGVPVIGCDCERCVSTDPRDRRSRHAAVLEFDGRTLLIDTPPELRLQLIGAGVERVDAVWFTHTHADHVHGIDDLRTFSARTKRPVPAFACDQDAIELRDRFPYIFDPSLRPIPGTYLPKIEFTIFRPFEPIEVLGRSMMPIEVEHGPTRVHGFRIGSLGYITDAKSVSERAIEVLAGVRTLVINALWFEKPHPTQMNVEEAIETSDRIGAERVFLTHLTHRVGHAELEERLPSHIVAAHDGLRIEGFE